MVLNDHGGYGEASIVGEAQVDDHGYGVPLLSVGTQPT